MNRFWLLIALVSIPALFCVVANADTVKPAEYSVRASAVLDEVWNNIKKGNFSKDFDREFKAEVYDRFRPEILKCQDDQELATTLNRMIKKLNQSHIFVLPPVNSTVKEALTIADNNAAPVNAGAVKSAVPADPGISLAVAENKLCVLRVKPGFPAAQAGIKPGDEILSIDGVKINPANKTYVGWALIASSMLAGQPDTAVKIELKQNEEIRTVNLTRQANGEKWFKLGVMPPTFGSYQSEMLPGNIGCLRFSAFFPEMIVSCRQDVTGKLKNADGIIIDLRGNVGGIILLGEWLAGWLSSQPVKLGTMIIKGTELKPKSYPQPGCFRKPLAILIDNDSYSTAEIFAAAMRDAKVAVLFGQTTPGKCLPSQFLILPSGFRLQTVFGDFVRVDGKRIEHIGVKPDFPVELKLEDLRKGIDTVQEATRKYLAKK
ncbi:MAG: S41 family peptidase [Victivallaceae bacterium]